MAPTIILIRHAQAEHNVDYRYSIPDPPLTALGFNDQCRTLREHLQKLPLASDIELIVISPMRRTLQTAEQTLGWLIERGVPVQLRAEWQENSSKPCDTGSLIQLMREEWPQFDWSTVDPVFPAKKGLYEVSQEDVTKRGIEAKKALKERPEKVIAVFTHAGFLRIGVCQRRFANADYRVFDFAEEGYKDEGGVRLVERRETQERGGGLGISEKGFFGVTEEEVGKMAREKKENLEKSEIADKVPPP